VNPPFRRPGRLALLAKKGIVKGELGDESTSASFYVTWVHNQCKIVFM
jgi:hypothetical protein